MIRKKFIAILMGAAMTTTIVSPAIPVAAQTNTSQNQEKKEINNQSKYLKLHINNSDNKDSKLNYKKEVKKSVEVNSDKDNNNLRHDVESNKLENKKINSFAKLSTSEKNPVDQASIKLENVWNWNIGVLSFNSNEKKIIFTPGGSETNPYANAKETLFKISLVNSNGLVTREVSINGSEYPEKAISEAFNNLSFNYGDKLLITYVNSSSKIYATGLINNNSKEYKVDKTTAFSIEPNGISIFNNQKLTVNPLQIEGAKNLVTDCTVTGQTVPESEVTVLVDGKTFTTKSNYIGNFSVPINDENGLKSSTAITVCATGQIPVTVYPTAIPNLGIDKAKVYTIYNCKLTQEGLTFNTTTLKANISETGTNQFSANLIENGKPIAKSETAYFNGFSGASNLKNVDFKYGDILSVYQTNQSKIDWGNVNVDTGTSVKTLNPDEFGYYEITPNGLVPVSNKNLTVNQPYYNGGGSVDISGKTTPNTNVTVSAGSYSTTVRSNSAGEYTAIIPQNDISVGDVVSVYVNNKNFKQIIYSYSKNYALGTNKIQVSNYYGQPIFYVGFNAKDLKFIAAKNITYYNYSGGQQTGNRVGTFYSNNLDFKLINHITGDIIYNFTTNKLNDSSSFVNEINGKTYNVGDILEVSYNPNLLNIDVTSNNINIGSKGSNNQYFEITNKGLVNISNKFIEINPINILGTNKTTINITGKVKPNSEVNIKVGNNIFKGESNSSGNFSIPINVVNGFEPTTNIVVSSDGYIPTNVNLGYDGKVNIQNSHINFYNQGSPSAIQSSIGFNPENMQFTVQNYVSSFGKGNENYFTFGFYNADGTPIIEPTAIKNGSTSALANLLSGKSFKYGDVISISYNPKISIPVALNNQTVLANINGSTEYFEITKEGLVKVNFGEKIYTNEVNWNGTNLELNITPSIGNNLTIENSVAEILDSSNTVIASSNISNGNVEFTSSQLSKLTNQKDYKFEVKINNKQLPIYVNSNIPSSSMYKLFTNANNQLSISLNHLNYNIEDSNAIASYSKKVNDGVVGTITNNDSIVNTLNNRKAMNDVITNAFINRFGISNLQKFYNESTENANFINWVLNNDVGMSEYLQATNIGEANIDSLQIWSDIWNEYTNSHTGFNLKLAIATAIANETTIHDCFNGKPVGSPVERYNIFENLNSDGGMVKGFETLNVKLLEAVVDVPITNSQIIEMRSLLLQNHNNLISSNSLPSTDYTINYTFNNPYNGATIFGNWKKFYGENETVADVFKIGGVCGAISRLGSVACRVFGQPAHQMGEPGHDAFYTYDIQNHQWYSQYGETTVANATGFDVSHWSDGLALNGNIVTYNALYTAANNKNLIESNQYLWMANSTMSYNLKLQAINNAIQAQPLNVEAWLAKINLLNSNPNVTANDYINLYNQLISALKDYPEPMFDLLVKFNKHMIQVTTSTEYNNFVKDVTRVLQEAENSNDASTSTQANRILKDGYMTKYGFTFDQPKLLGQININTWQKNVPTDAIIFKDNGKIYVNANHWWIGSSWSNKININIFDENMNPKLNVQDEGTDFGTGKIYSTFNNLQFKIGDIIEINYNPGQNSHGYLSLGNMNLSTKNIPDIVAIQITKNGLKVLDGEYTAPDGKMYNFYTGFKNTKYGTKYYIFGVPQIGMQTINNKEYYFNQDGIMQTGLQTINNNGYYFNQAGVMQTGWQTIDGEKYYFGVNGKAMPGYQTINGTKYLFANNGLEIQNIIPDSDMKVSSYSTEQNNTTYSANNIIDGNLNNNWQNVWNHSDKNPYITIELNHIYNLKTLLCFPRQDGSSNGNIEKYKILVSTDGKDFRQVAQGNWVYSNSKEPQFVNLNGVKAKYIKIESEKGVFNLATIAEVILSGTSTETVNKTELSNELGKANNALKNKSEYTKASAENLTNAIKNANNVMENSNATPEQVNNAIKDLSNAISNKYGNNPKTGDTSEVPEVLGIGVALIALVRLRFKKIFNKKSK